MEAYFVRAFPEVGRPEQPRYDTGSFGGGQQDADWSDCFGRCWVDQSEADILPVGLLRACSTLPPGVHLRGVCLGGAKEGMGGQS